MMRWSGLSLLLLLPLLLVTNARAQAPARVIVLGVDGFDHALCEELIQAGKLPELQRLAAAGSFERLRPTNPAQSPTSWASLATGRNPGETRIFGFLRRRFDDEGEVIPEVALAEREPKRILPLKLRLLLGVGCLLVSLLPVIVRRSRRAAILSLTLAVILGGGLAWFLAQIPREVVLPRARLDGDPFWSALDREGIATVSLFAPMSFPAPKLEKGSLLCGLGVPDLRATAGSVALYRQRPFEGPATTQMGGRLIQLEDDAGGFKAELVGPKDPRDPDAGPLRKTLRVTPLGEGRYALALDEQRVELKVGEFSDFIPLSFPVGAFVTIEGTVRFRILSDQPDLRIYQEPLQFDPRRPNPLVPIASPRNYGPELAADGAFETLGWATATNPFQDGLIDEATLLDDAVGLFNKRRSLLLRELKRDDYRVAFAVLSTPDRIQHVFWRNRDPEHPAHEPWPAGKDDPITAFYRRIDGVVGDIRKTVLRENDLLLVVSDHGFASFRRAVNLNRWLVREGYLVPRESVSGEERRSLQEGLGKRVFGFVDWSKSRAYSLGLGRIWLNLAGREKQGIVRAEEADALRDEIAQKLLALRDGEHPVVRSVAFASKIYRGRHLEEASDLVVGFERGYRVSWNSCLGGVDHSVFFDNTTRWSGDHCSVDPDLVPGVLFSSRPLKGAKAARVVDIYPTLRDFLELSPVEGLDGVSLR